jgi:hypothetical protein
MVNFSYVVLGNVNISQLKNEVPTFYESRLLRWNNMNHGSMMSAQNYYIKAG